MSSSERALRNDAYGWIDAAAKDLLQSSRELVERGEAARVSDEAVAQLFTAAVRLYYAKADGEERTFSPIVGRNDEELSPTELLSAVAEMLRAMHLGPMELALWYRRRPDEGRAGPRRSLRLDGGAGLFLRQCVHDQAPGNAAPQALQVKPQALRVYGRPVDRAARASRCHRLRAWSAWRCRPAGRSAVARRRGRCRARHR